MTMQPTRCTEADFFDQAQAMAEGWGIYEQGAFGPYEIQADDEARVFYCDEDAVEFVKKRAAEGSEYHRRALTILGNVHD